MKAVCGFKDLEGNFHDKQKDAEISDANYKIKELKKAAETELFGLYNKCFESIDKPFISETMWHLNAYEQRVTPQGVINTMLQHPEFWIDYAKKLAQLKREHHDLINLQIEKQWWKFW